MQRPYSPWVYVAVTIALFILLALTVALAYVNLGPFSIVVALAIAASKALLVFLFFMHLLRGGVALRMTALLGFFMLALLGVLIMSDYIGRNRYLPRTRQVTETSVPVETTESHP